VVLKVLVVSHSDGERGAYKAASLLHRHLRVQGAESTMLVRVTQGDTEGVLAPTGRTGRWVSAFRDKTGVAIQRFFGSNDGNTLSLNALPSFWAEKINRLDIDVVNLQWVGQETMSIGDIGNIEKPVVWTSQDLWPLSGAKHYAYSYADARTSPNISDSGADSQKSDRWFDAEKWVLGRKKRKWRRNMSIICPSRWMADRVSNSEVAGSWHVEVIPNVVDTKLFKPLPKHFCRNVFNIDTNKKLVTCGAYNLLTDMRKGGDLVVAMLEKLASCAVASNIEICIFGQSEHAGNPKLPFKTHWIPRVYDQQTLALIYNLSDVVVVPSREDNLPQVGTEAQACGIPVAGFNCTGMPDVVDHLKTGYLATPFDTADMAEGINWLLESEDRYHALSANSRSRAVALWAPEIVIPQYAKAFHEAAGRARATGKHIRQA
jgi:glycosyltransferase involved in cell wall biosynthesis